MTAPTTKRQDYQGPPNMDDHRISQAVLFFFYLSYRFIDLESGFLLYLTLQTPRRI